MIPGLWIVNGAVDMWTVDMWTMVLNYEETIKKTTSVNKLFANRTLMVSFVI